MLFQSPGVRSFVRAALRNDPSTPEKCLQLSMEMCSGTSLPIRARHHSICGPPRCRERSMCGTESGVDKRLAGLVSVVWKVGIEVWGRDGSRQSLRVKGHGGGAVQRPERLAERWAAGRGRWGGRGEG